MYSLKQLGVLAVPLLLVGSLSAQNEQQNQLNVRGSRGAAARQINVQRVDLSNNTNVMRGGRGGPSRQQVIDNGSFSNVVQSQVPARGNGSAGNLVDRGRGGNYFVQVQEPSRDNVREPRVRNQVNRVQTVKVQTMEPMRQRNINPIALDNNVGAPTEQLNVRGSRTATPSVGGGSGARLSLGGIEKVRTPKVREPKALSDRLSKSKERSGKYRPTKPKRMKRSYYSQSRPGVFARLGRSLKGSGKSRKAVRVKSTTACFAFNG